MKILFILSFLLIPLIAFSGIDRSVVGAAHSRFVTVSEEEPLPEGVVPVEYLDSNLGSFSSGGPYIDTGILPSNDMTIYCRFRIDSNGGGIWNVAVETHDSSSGVWIDLINGREYVGKNFSWEDDAIVTTGGTVNDCRFVFSDLIGAERTREIVFQPISIGFGNDPAMRGSGDCTLDFALWGTRTPSLVAFFRNGNTFWTGVGEDIYLKRHLAVVNFSNKTYGYVDGILTLGSSFFFAQQGDMVFPMFSFNKFRIFAVRVYNRTLSDAEIAHNYSLDKMRFNIQ